MDQIYYDTVAAMEKKGVDPEYLNGWVSGYMHNPKREEQNITEAYSSGYEDGFNKKTDGF